MFELLKCPLPEVVVKSAESATIISDPVSPLGSFYPHGFEVEPELARHFMVTDVKVGINSQLVSSGCFPCSLFAASTPLRLRMDRMLPGSRIVVSVTNCSATSVMFKGAVLGSRKRYFADPLYVLGLGYSVVRTPSALVTIQTQVPLRPRALYVPPYVLDDFDVVSLKQGKYLDSPEQSSVDPSRLTKPSLLAGGEIEFSPVPYAGAGAPLSVLVSRVGSPRTVVGVKVDDNSPRYFTGAILASPVDKTTESQSDES